MKDQTFGDQPLISVVTIVKNDVEGLQRTRLSVESQERVSLQHIVVAGSSTDGTLELSQQWGNLGLIDVCADRDTGIYDAMNRGLSFARAPWVWFLNAGDMFSHSGSAQRAIEQVKGASWAFGAVIPTDVTGERRGTTLLPHITRRRLQWGDVYLNHQALIMQTEFLRKIGSFDASFKSAGEFDMYLRALAFELPRRIPCEWVNFLVGGSSMTNADLHIREMRRSRELRLNLNATGMAVNDLLTNYRLLRHKLGSKHYPLFGFLRRIYLSRKYGL